MKKLFFVFLFVGTCLSAQIDATISPIGILWGDLSLSADFAIKENMSVDARIGFGSGDLNTADWNNYVLTAFGKYYFNPQMGTDRFYIGPFLQYIRRNYEYEDDSPYADYDQSRFGIGFALGWKIVPQGNFVFDANVGVGMALVDKTEFDETDAEQKQQDWTDVMLTGKLGIGYRFGN